MLLCNVRLKYRRADAAHNNTPVRVRLIEAPVLRPCGFMRERGGGCVSVWLVSGRECSLHCRDLLLGKVPLGELYHLSRLPLAADANDGTSHGRLT